MFSNISRREALVGAAAVSGLQLLPNMAFAQKLPTDGKMSFDVYRNGKSSIGQHQLSFVEKDGRLMIDNKIDINVKIAGISAFKVKGLIRELWQGERLVALQSKINENGKSSSMDARAIGDKLRVQSSVAGTFDAPGDIMPTSYWNMAVVKSTKLLDPRNGKMLTVATKAVGRKEIDVASSKVKATRFDMQGDVKMSIWYSAASEWVGMDFDAKGQKVSYRRSA